MEPWQAFLLGIVEGATEFLPVSSTGHLLVCQHLLGLPDSSAMRAFAIAIQAGAILAVLGLYRARITQMAHGALGRNPAGKRLLIAVGVAFLPAAVLGTLFDDAIEQKLFGVWPVVAAWIAGGLLLVAVRRWSSERPGAVPLEKISLAQALAIGVIQCLAMWPGTSRSLVTLMGALAVGLTLTAALEFSFLLGLVTLCAASSYKLLDSYAALSRDVGWWNFALGLGSAWLFAWLSVRWMVAFVGRRGLVPFGWYRIAIGLGVGTWLLLGPHGAPTLTP